MLDASFQLNLIASDVFYFFGILFLLRLLIGFEDKNFYIVHTSVIIEGKKGLVFFSAVMTFGLTY